MPKRNYTLWSPLLLRIVLGCGFILHGLAKLSNGRVVVGRLLAQIGVPFPHLTYWIIPGIEALGGLAILLGFYIRTTAVLLIFILLVAMLTVQATGYEVNLLYIAGLLSLIITGAGKPSMGTFKKEKRRNDFYR
jgi:putative oxidoreductase